MEINGTDGGLLLSFLKCNWKDLIILSFKGKP